MGDNHECTQKGPLSDHNARLVSVENRQERHHTWTERVEKECRKGIDDVEQYVQKKHEEVIKEIGKAKWSNIKMTLYVMAVFGSLFVILALLLRPT